ncbi:MAG: VWA domain-containing protein [Deltaproteobacteria bacterium]|nr:VWA domain-containing protein [Deltaproteobacteria bacterium]
MARAWRDGRIAAIVSLTCAGCLFDYGFFGDGEEVVRGVLVEESFVQQAAPWVDVLFVIDNTASMEAEQEALAQGFGSFIENLEEAGVDYQAGVVTTDVSGPDAGLLRGVPWIVTSRSEDPVVDFEQASQVGTLGASPEAGLGAAWLALTEPLRSGGNRGFRRDGAVLQVVVVSDTDDRSEDILGPDPAAAFLSFLSQERAETGAEAFLSAVAGPVPMGCSGPHGRAQPAYRYTEVVEEAEGVFASICEGDMGAVLQAIAASSLVYPTTFRLQAEPDPDTLRVAVDDLRLDTGWLYDLDPPSVVFDEPPDPDARISVRYRLAGGST